MYQKVVRVAGDRSFDQLVNDADFLDLAAEFIRRLQEFITAENEVREKWNKNDLSQWVLSSGIANSNDGALYFIHTTFNMQKDGDISTHGDLSLHNYPQLNKLPPNLTVNGSLFLIKCRFLQHLPSRLHVIGDLDLSGCSALKSLPTDIWISGRLILDAATAHLYEQAEELWKKGQILSVTKNY